MSSIRLLRLTNAISLTKVSRCVSKYDFSTPFDAFTDASGALSVDAACELLGAILHLPGFRYSAFMRAGRQNGVALVKWKALLASRLRAFGGAEYRLPTNHPILHMKLLPQRTTTRQKSYWAKRYDEKDGIRTRAFYHRWHATRIKIQTVNLKPAP
jgi:hypothetical protein